MSYTTYDFKESLERAPPLGLSASDVAEVVAAWGRTGDYAEWEGGFLLRLKDGRHAYLSGWCDTTGWGCQDGIDVHFYQERPEPLAIAPEEWDDHPVDLARHLGFGAP